MPKKLKIWNGRGSYVRQPKGPSKFYDRFYVCAYSQADAVEVCKEAGANLSLSEIRGFYSSGCWGNTMDGITPERGLWAQEKHNSKPIRLR